ncbi:MAG: CYTH domain-containing protein [Magnetococcales bacterium]|nr:CYTH domain-containing protein [Magnetococcales bacterium]
MDSPGVWVEPLTTLSSEGLAGPEWEQEIRLRAADVATLEAMLIDLGTRPGACVLDRAYEDRYLDGRDRPLLRARLAVRVRRCVSGDWLEIKGEGVCSAGVWQRPEWRQPGVLEWLGEVDELADGPVRQMLMRHLSAGVRLEELFVCAIQRQEVHLTADRIAVCLDHGVVRTAQRQYVLTEVELEQRGAARSALTAWAEQLTDRYGLLPAPHSKFRIGLSLLEQE